MTNTTVNNTAPTRITVAPVGQSVWYEMFDPTNAVAEPMSGDSHSMRPKDFVSIRAVIAGVTSRAEMSSTPMTRIVTSTVSESSVISRASMRATGTPVTWATSGSNVANRSGRY
ncbi:unannotated protein [freshwater metagenome]|uniref:Unannotated protein n=1 Tax=freshwater metagenome TaxID=449393 RepID=A0A6J7U539_9ZZZZ